MMLETPITADMMIESLRRIVNSDTKDRRDVHEDGRFDSQGHPISIIGHILYDIGVGDVEIHPFSGNLTHTAWGLAYTVSLRSERGNAWGSILADAEAWLSGSKDTSDRMKMR